MANTDIDLQQNTRVPWFTQTPTAIASVSTPPDSGDIRITLDPDDNKLKWTDSAGADHELGVQKTLAYLTNKSGGGVIAGDVVIIDTTNDAAFTTSTAGAETGIIGIAQETIANDAAGDILIAGYAALVLTSASVTRGNFAETHTVAKQATENATIQEGSFAQFLTGGATPTAWLFGTAVAGTGGGASLTVQDESGTVSDTAVTVIKVPDGALVDNGVGDVSIRELPVGVVGAAVRRNAAVQAVGAASWTKLTLDTTDYDTDGYFDDGNDRLTIPTGMTGPHVISALAYTATANDNLMSVYKNGSAFKTVSVRSSNTVSFVDLGAAAGDYYEVWAYGVGAYNWGYASGDQLETALTIHKLGSGNVAGLDTDEYALTSGDKSLTNTSWADIDSASDLTVPAQAGDRLLINFSAHCNSATPNLYIDAATIVSASPVNYVSGGAGGATHRGVQAWGGWTAEWQNLGGSILYEVVAGDIENESVTLRLRNWNSTSSPAKVLYAQSDIPLHWSVVNLRQTSQRGERKGTSFPTGPATNERFIRTDIDNMEFFYDGTRWVSSQMFTASQTTGIGGVTVDAQAIICTLDRNYSTWIERMEVTTYVSSSATWVVTLQTLNYNNTSTGVTDGTQSTSGDATGVFINRSVTIDQEADGTQAHSGAVPSALKVLWDEQTGTATFIGEVTVYYRLIAT